MFAASPAAIYLVDRDGVVTEWNPAAERIFGFSVDEALGRTLPFVPSVSLPIRTAMLERIIAGDTVVGLEFDAYHAHGQVITISLAAAPLRAADDTIHGAVVIAEDVTAVRESQRLAQEQKERLRTIFEAASDGIILMGSDGKIVVANPAAHTILGFEPESMAGGAALTAGHLALTDVAGNQIDPANAPLKQTLSDRQPRRNVLMWVSQIGSPQSKLLAYNTQPMEGGGALATFREVTDLHRAQDLFRVAVEASTNAILLTDERGDVVLANSASAHLLRYAHEDLIGRPVLDLVPPGVRPHHEQLQQSYLRSPAARPMGMGRELTARRSDGTEVPVEVSLQPVRTDRGAHVLVAMTDITERKRSAAELETAHRRLVTLLHTAPAAIYALDRAGGVVLWNNAAERLFGVTHERVPGAGLPAPIAPATEDGQVPPMVSREVRWRRPDGRWIDVRLAASFYPQEAGAPFRTLVVASDITDEMALSRKNAEHLSVLQDTLARLVAVLDAASDGILLVDHEGVIRTANRAMTDLFPVTGLKSLDALHLMEWASHSDALFDNPEMVREILERALKGKGLQTPMLFEQYWPEQRTIQISVQQVMPAAGGEGFILVGFSDVSELRAASQAKDELLSLVGHELKSPLTALTGYLDLLQITYGPTLDDEVTEYLAIMGESIDHLNALLNDLLDLSHIEAGRITLELGPLDINHLVRQCTSALRRSSLRSSTTLSYTFRSVCPTWRATRHGCGKSSTTLFLMRSSTLPQAAPSPSIRCCVAKLLRSK